MIRFVHLSRQVHMILSKNKLWNRADSITLSSLALILKIGGWTLSWVGQVAYKIQLHNYGWLKAKVPIQIQLKIKNNIWFQICGANRPFVVMSALTLVDEKGVRTLHCLLQYVDEVGKISGSLSAKNVENRSQFCNVVEWITLVESAESCISTWKLDRLRRFAFFGSLVKNDYSIDYNKSIKR
jgi:hypothetical protein